jgi:hypothetical protein
LLSQPISTESKQTSYEEHPAVGAWREVQPDRTEVARLEVVEGSSQPTSVYRLRGVGKGGSTVIAKRCRRRTALVERVVYEEILPELPLPMLHYYGFYEEPDGAFCWLFVEDVSREKYDPRQERHHVAAARWLGIMNMSAASIGAAGRLPSRTPVHYLKLLRSARDSIRLSASNPVLDAADLALLKTVVAHCDHLSVIW